MVLLRHAWLAAGLLLAGCYEPFPPSGSPCKAEEAGSCPTGLSCIRGTCRAEVGASIDASVIPEIDASTIDGSAADVDGDGKPNTADNCPGKPNLDQHDEDADGVGDVCDNCPHVANANQAATGEVGTVNGVGDLCDPRPGLPGDTIQRFYSFHVPPSLTSTLGTWTLDADTYRFAGGTEGALTVTGDRDKISIEIAGSLESNTNDLFIGVAAGVTADPYRYYDCGYFDDGQVNDFHNGVIEYFYGGGFDLLAGNHDLAQRLSGAFTIRMSADSTIDRVTCTTIDARGMANKQINNAGQLRPGEVGVKSDFAAYRLRYLVVFGQP